MLGLLTLQLHAAWFASSVVKLKMFVHWQLRWLGLCAGRNDGKHTTGDICCDHCCMLVQQISMLHELDRDESVSLHSCLPVCHRAACNASSQV